MIGSIFSMRFPISVITAMLTFYSAKGMNQADGRTDSKLASCLYFGGGRIITEGRLMHFRQVNDRTFAVKRRSLKECSYHSFYLRRVGRSHGELGREL